MSIPTGCGLALRRAAWMDSSNFILNRIGFFANDELKERRAATVLQLSS